MDNKCILLYWAAFKLSALTLLMDYYFWSRSIGLARLKSTGKLCLRYAFSEFIIAVVH